MPLAIGLLGCGVIGRSLAQAVDAGDAGAVQLKLVYDVIPEAAQRLRSLLRHPPAIASEPRQLAADASITLVVEAASQDAVRQHAKLLLDAGKDLLIMSVGALADEQLRRTLEEAAWTRGRHIYTPSGAIGGLDVVKAAAALGGLRKVRLRSSKPPAALAGAPFLVERGIDPAGIHEPRVLFEGSARVAAPAFPANVNVAVTLALAGLGLDATHVEVVADPRLTRNIHEVEAEGEFGRLFLRVENVPAPGNPRTSYLAVLSAIRRLRDLSATLHIGT